MVYDAQRKTDLTSRDWRSIVDDFIKPGGYIETYYGSKYTEFRDTEFGRMLIDLVAAIGDVFHYQLDVEANESNLLTARQIQSVIDFAQSIGYDPRGPTSSRAAIQIVFPTYTGSYTLLKGTQFTTNPQFGSQQIFELEADLVKVSGQDTITGFVTSGESIEDPAFVSGGDGRTQIQLQRTGLIDRSEVVVIDGVTWTRVSDFSQSGPGNTHYRIRTEEVIPGTRRSYIQFGDGNTGMYPSAGSVAIVTYRVNGGTTTNVPDLAIDRLVVNLTDVNGDPIAVLVSNPQAASGGLDPETIDQIRINAPTSVSMNARNVSLQDHVDAALKSGAIRARAFTNNEWNVVPENTVLVFVATSLSTSTTITAADAIKASMLTLYPGRETRRLLVVPCGLVDFNVHLAIYMRRTTTQTVLDPLVRASLQEFYSVDSITGVPPKYVVDIAKSLRLSNITDRVEDLDGVSFTRILSPTTDLTPGQYQMPRIDPLTWTIDYLLDPEDV
jgi:hypothetical protein